MKNLYAIKTRLLVIAISGLMLGGCATTSVFTSYPSQIQKVKQQITSKQFSVAEAELFKHKDDADKILYMMELGRTTQIAADFPKSIDAFKLVIEEMQLNEEKATITASGAMQQGASLLTNDNAIPYSGEPYERIFVHQFQAMNYLFSKDLDSALVEVRRANEQQHLALQNHESEVAKAEEKEKESLEKNKGFMNSFASLQNVAGKVKNSFQNAYTFYASALIYEIQGNYNDAYIDYKKALEIFPGNIYLQKDVLRLAKQLSMNEDYDRFSGKFKVEAAAPDASQGEVIVLFEHGFAPVKQEIKVAINTFNNIHTSAFPTYATIWKEAPPLSISTDGQKLGETAPIIYVQSLAAKALQEQLPAMMIRQVLRIAAKKQVADKSGKAFGDLGKLGATIFNMVSENADMRSWLTLPNDAQILRNSLPAGEHQLQLTNGTASDTHTITVVPGKKTIIRAISAGKSMYTQSVVL
jgi:hypothetical protein